MVNVPSSDIGAVLGAAFAFSNNTVEATPASGAPELIVAAGAGDNTAITGNTIDRDDFGYPASGILVVSSYLNLADTETYSLAISIQESSDDSTWDTAEVIEAAAVVKTASGAFTDGHVETYKVYLGDRKRYIRFNCTPNFSASGTDTGVVQGSLVFVSGTRTALLPAHQATD